MIRGYEGIRRFFEEVDGIFDEIVFEEEEILEFGDEVLVVDPGRFRGRTSGVDVTARGAIRLDDSRSQARTFPFLPDERGCAGGPGAGGRSGLAEPIEGLTTKKKYHSSARI